MTVNSIGCGFVEMSRVAMALTTTRWEHAWQSWRRISNLPKVFFWSRFVVSN